MNVILPPVARINWGSLQKFILCENLYFCYGLHKALPISPKGPQPVSLPPHCIPHTVNCSSGNIKLLLLGPNACSDVACYPGSDQLTHLSKGQKLHRLDAGSLIEVIPSDSPIFFRMWTLMCLLKRGHYWRCVYDLGRKVMSSLIFEVSARNLSQRWHNRLSFCLTSRLPLALATSLKVESFFFSLRSCFFSLLPAESSFIISPKVLQRQRFSPRSQSWLSICTFDLTLAFLGSRVSQFDLFLILFSFTIFYFILIIWFVLIIFCLSENGFYTRSFSSFFFFLWLTEPVDQSYSWYIINAILPDQPLSSLGYFSDNNDWVIWASL